LIDDGVKQGMVNINEVTCYENKGYAVGGDAKRRVRARRCALVFVNENGRTKTSTVQQREHQVRE